MKNILIISSTSVTGGGTQFCIGISKFLKSNNCSVFYIGPNDSEEFYRLAEICDDVFDINLKNLRPLDIYQIFKLIRQKKMNIIHSNGKVPGIYAYLLSALFRNLRVIHTFHGIHYAHKGPAYRLFTLLIEKLFLQANIIRHFVSFSEKKLFQQYFGIPRKSVVIGNTNFQEKEHVEIELTCVGDAYLYLGRITEVKNIEFIVKNIIELNNEKVLETPIKLNVVGFIDDVRSLSKNDYVYQEMIREIVCKQDVNFVVNLLPSTADPLTFIKNCKAIILASDAEGMPLVFLEAMSIGKPLIGASVPGISDLVDDEVNGFLFTPNDNNDFKSKILQLEQNENLAVDMGQASLVRYRSNYSNRIFYDRIVKLYFDED